MFLGMQLVIANPQQWWQALVCADEAWDNGCQASHGVLRSLNVSKSAPKRNHNKWKNPTVHRAPQATRSSDCKPCFSCTKRCFLTYTIFQKSKSKNSEHFEASKKWFQSALMALHHSWCTTNEVYIGHQSIQKCNNVEECLRNSRYENNDYGIRHMNTKCTWLKGKQQKCTMLSRISSRPYFGEQELCKLVTWHPFLINRRAQ